MRAVVSMACLALCVAGAGAARAESGGLFKNLLGGGSGSDQGALENTPGSSGPQLYDPDAVYCPNVSIREGSAALQSYAGAAGDSSRLRHQITFARFSRECRLRADGAATIKVGVELRALIGPAGVPGSFEAPVTISVNALGKTLDSRTRRVRVTVPAGAAHGTASLIEDALIVPAANAGNYDIEIALAGAAAKSPAAKPKPVAKRSGKPARTEASAESGAPAAGQ